MDKELKNYLKEKYFNDYILIFETVTGDLKYKVATYKENLLKSYNLLKGYKQIVPFTIKICLVNNL